jgi:hypothetical protein
MCEVSDPLACGGLGASCVPVETCHEQDLCLVDEDGNVLNEDLCWDSTGRAGSPKSCNDARKNETTVWGGIESLGDISFQRD